jgi:hypothetical protein
MPLGCAAMMRACAILLVLGMSGLARGQQTIAQYHALGEGLFCEQDLDALDKAVKLSPEQRDAVASLLRAALAKAVSITGRWNREGAERWEKLGQAKLSPEQREEAMRTLRADGVRDSVSVGAELAAVEREALADVRTLLTAEQIERGWAEFERFRRRVLVESGAGVTHLGHSPASIVEPLKLGKADAEAIAGILKTYERDLDALVLARMSEIEKLNKELAETGEQGGGAFERPGMKTDEIRKLQTQTILKIGGALSAEARDRLIRQRVGVQFGGIDRVGKDDWTMHMMRVASLSSEQKEQMAGIIAKGDDTLFQTLLAGVRACDDVVLRDGTSEEVRRVFHDAYRRAAAVVSESRAKVRAVLTPAQVEELDADVARQNNPSDPFTEKRSKPVDSTWLTGPNQPGKQN